MQLVRIAQLQQEMDATRKDTAELRKDLAAVHTTLKGLISA